MAISKGLNFRGLTDEALAELIELDMSIDLEKQNDYLEQLRHKLIFIDGKKGKGKTASAVGLCYWFRESFNQPVVCVGSKMGLLPSFGPFDYVPEGDFKEELSKIDLAANEDENAEHVAEIFHKKGIHLIGATVVFDEAHKLMNARTPQDKMVKLTVQFIAQSRHYDCTCIVLSPTELMIDKLIRLQFDWKGSAFFNKYTKIVTTHLQYGLDVVNFEVDLLDGSTHTPFGLMYNTKNLVGYRKSSLHITEAKR